MVSAALLKVAVLTDDVARGARYYVAAEHILNTLIRHWLIPLASGETCPEGMLVGACYHPTIGHAVNCEAIWPHYYLFEALEILTGRLPPARL
jgi:hypothetical protein